MILNKPDNITFMELDSRMFDGRISWVLKVGIKQEFEIRILHHDFDETSYIHSFYHHINNKVKEYKL